MTRRSTTEKQNTEMKELDKGSVEAFYTEVIGFSEELDRKIKVLISVDENGRVINE